MVNIVRQENRDHEGNDCYIYDTHLILEFAGSYMYMHIVKYNGGWTDNKVHYEEGREFDNEQQASNYMDMRLNRESEEE